MVRFAEKRRAAMDAMMKDEVYHNSVEILTNHGPQALTMDRLAKAIGVSRGTLYNYFSDRDAVLTYVDERAIEPVITETEAIVTSKGSAEDKLTRHAMSLFRLVETSKPLLYALYLKEVAEGTRREAQIRIYDGQLAKLVTILKQGMKRGEFRKLPLPDAAVMFISVLRGHLDYMADHDISHRPEEVVSTLMQVIMPAFRA